MAGGKFLQAARLVRDKRTVDALLLLAENYEYRAKVARERNPAPVEDEDEEGEGDAGGAGDGAGGGSLLPKEDGEAADRELAAETDGKSVERQDTSAATEAQLNMAAVEMEELWRRLHEIGLSSGGASDKVCFFV